MRHIKIKLNEITETIKKDGGIDLLKLELWNRLEGLTIVKKLKLAKTELIELRECKLLYEMEIKGTMNLSNRINSFDGILGNIEEFIVFIEDLCETYESGITEDKELEELGTKLNWKSSPSIMGFIFLELVHKGYIEVPLKNGEANYTSLSRYVNKMFNIKTTPNNLSQFFCS